MCAGFDKKYPLAEDQDLYYKLEEVGIIIVIDEPLYYYRIHKRSISKNDNLATAYAYHLFAMFAAKKRRPYNEEENNAIKFSFLHFMSWGIMKIKKPLRAKILIKAIITFPELIRERIVMSAMYGLLKKQVVV
jgi:GT2 family glycosyltransferase